MNTLPERLQWAREHAGLSARDLDKLADLTPGHTASVEVGRRASPSADTVRALARALGISTDWLIDGTGKRPSETLLKSLAKSA
jgi:transcriptional regulator with XRE-family HTH domain